MRKTLIYSSLAVLGLCSFAGFSPRRAPEHAEDVKNIVEEFVDSPNKKYTKKTQIHLNELALEELVNYFHAGANAAKRRTYYDEVADALLMGNFEGGFTNINSGYAKNGSNMDHFEYVAATPDAATLFNPDPAYRHVTYSVPDTTPNAYFVNLSSIAEEVYKNAWTLNGTTYEYTITDLTYEGDDYKDVLLHKVQYFAAPMLLQSFGSYLSPSKITFEKSDDELLIKLFVSSGDLSKLDNGDGLLAEASVKKGLILN